MNYTVVWKPEAERRLATIWNQATDRSAIAKATHLIDKALGTDPQETGESREEGFRVIFERPLGVMFEVSPDDRMAKVVAVWTVEQQHKCNGVFYVDGSVNSNAYVFAASSLHPGGANFAFADGSVRFLKDTIQTMLFDQTNGQPKGITGDFINYRIPFTVVPAPSSAFTRPYLLATAVR